MSVKKQHQLFMQPQQVDYIDSTKYTDWQAKLKDLVSVMNEQQSKAIAFRRLRYSEINIEQERRTGRLAPDELYIPQHIIDTNIRREQAPYVQYVTQSNRAVILTHKTNPTISGALLEKDVTKRLRYAGWQQSMYGNIDAMQQNGYSIMEVVLNQDKSGDLAHEYVSLGDFGVINDTKDLQETEMLSRAYYFSKTKLLEMCDPKSPWQFKKEQVLKVITSETSGTTSTDAIVDKKDRSLYKVHKVMFRVKGIVHVAWANDEKADDWLRNPRPLFIGRKKVDDVGQLVDEFETDYPYFLFPYLISENDTIVQLKGRCYLDQDCQEAVSSLMSSFCTAHRRGSGLYFSKDTDDPNDDVLMEKNVYFRTGALINKKIKQFQLTVPDADTLSAIQALVTANMQETSQINFAAQNRKDSRKTATEISAATQSAQSLSTVQVVLFSTALRSMYQLMFDVIRSRVLAGVLKVDQQMIPYYQQEWLVKPSGDVDVIERQQLVQQMMTAWPVMQNTPANVSFLSDLVSLMFPETGQKYVQIFLQAQQQQATQAQSAQAQQLAQANALATQVVNLSKQPDMFSDKGKLHALPLVQQAASQIEQMRQPQQQSSQK